jgi:hypothetical protein
MNENQKILAESTLLLNEAYHVNKRGAGVNEALAKALEEANKVASSKGLKPIKNLDELTGMEQFKSKFDAGVKGILRAVTKWNEYKTMTIKGQVVVMNNGLVTARSAIALYRDGNGKLKTVTLKFHKYLTMGGKLKDSK